MAWAAESPLLYSCPGEAMRMSKSIGAKVLFLCNGLLMVLLELDSIEQVLTFRD